MIHSLKNIKTPLQCDIINRLKRLNNYSVVSEYINNSIEHIWCSSLTLPMNGFLQRTSFTISSDMKINSNCKNVFIGLLLVLKLKKRSKTKPKWSYMTIKFYSQLNIMLVLVQVEEANINITKPANKLKQNLISHQRSSRS